MNRPAHWLDNEPLIMATEDAPGVVSLMLGGKVVATWNAVNLDDFNERVRPEINARVQHDIDEANRSIKFREFF